MGEKEHFTRLLKDKGHIWWGHQTKAGKLRNDKKIELFRKLIKPQSGELLLEVGCGTGEYTGRLALMDLNVWAFDLTEACVAEARRRVGATRRCRFSVADITRVPFKDSTFDICLGVSILHHVDLKRAWPEIVRACKNGGRFFFSEPNMLNPHIFLEKNIPWLKKELEDSPHETAFVRWKLQKKLNSFWGTEARVKNIDFLHPLIPGRLIGVVEKMSDLLEKLPLVKEISGSLAIFGTILK